MTPRGKRIVGSAAAAVIGGLMIGSAAQAGLVLDLKFSDGTSQKNVTSAAAGSVFDIDVWATVTGVDGNNENDAFNGAYFGLLTKVLTANVSGNLAKGNQYGWGVPANGGNSGAVNDTAAFANLGTTKDGMLDWAGPATNSQTGWAKASFGVGVYAGQGTIDGVAFIGAPVPQGITFKIATVPFTLGSVAGALPADETVSLEVVPAAPTILASTRAAWREDGVAKTAANGPDGKAVTGDDTYLMGTSVKFSVKQEGPVPFVDIDADATLVDLGTVLRGVPLPNGTVKLSNVGTLAGDYSTQEIGLGSVVSGGAGNIAAGGSADLVVSLKNASGKPNGLKSGTVNVDVPAGDPDGDFAITVNAIVGLAAPGQQVKAQIQAGGSYKGIGLSVAPGQNMLGTDADLLGGTSDGGEVSFKFLPRADNNVGLPKNVGLISDILELTTDDDSTIESFVLSMTYDDSLMAGLGKDEAKAARAGYIFLGWDGGGQWVNAVAGNIGGTATFHGVGPVPTFGDDVSAMLGHWGVDINTNTVWAVLNHNSRFAVLPEPATFGLLGLGAMGLLARRRRA